MSYHIDISPLSHDLYGVVPEITLWIYWKSFQSVLTTHTNDANLDCSEYSTPCPEGCMEINDCRDGMTCGYYYIPPTSLTVIYFIFGCSCGCQEAVPSITDDISIRSSLYEVYNSTHGEEWFESTNWNRDDLTYCSYFGISCDANLTVVKLGVIDNNLMGSLPSGLLHGVSSITSINLQSNHLSGTLPSSIGSLHSLHSLLIDNNHLTGINIILISWSMSCVCICYVYPCYRYIPIAIVPSATVQPPNGVQYLHRHHRPSMVHAIPPYRPVQRQLLQRHHTHT